MLQCLFIHSVWLFFGRVNSASCSSQRRLSRVSIYRPSVTSVSRHSQKRGGSPRELLALITTVPRLFGIRIVFAMLDALDQHRNTLSQR